MNEKVKEMIYFFIMVITGFAWFIDKANFRTKKVNRSDITPTD